MRYLWIAPLIFAVGCSDSHEGASRLASGRDCIVVGDRFVTVETGKDFPDETFKGATRKGRSVTIPGGSLVRVITDEDEKAGSGLRRAEAGFDKSAPPWIADHPSSARRVTMLILDGPAKGERVELPRYALRPTP
jgi:hypothetical protein